MSQETPSLKKIFFIVLKVLLALVLVGVLIILAFFVLLNMNAGGVRSDIERAVESIEKNQSQEINMPDDGIEVN